MRTIPSARAPTMTGELPVGDGEEPALEAIAVLILWKSLPGTYEHLLHQILRVICVAHLAHQEGE